MGGPLLMVPDDDTWKIHPDSKAASHISLNRARGDDAGVYVILPPQPEIRMERHKNGSVTLTEIDGLGNEQSIFISSEFADTFIDRLTDAWGIPSFP